MRELELLVMFAATLSLASCMKDGNGTDGNKEVIVDYEVVKPMNSLVVDGREGQVANVIIGEDTIATCYGTTNVLIPNRQYDATRADGDVKIVYSPVEPNEQLSIGILRSVYYYILAFEDSPQADNDYNDLVMHVYQGYSNNSIRIDLHPVAMGNTRVLKFGADIYHCDSSMKVLSAARMYYSDNVKKDFFGESDELVMINTYPTIASLNTYPGYRVTPRFTSIDGKDYQYINYKQGYNSILPQSGIVANGNVYLNWFIELPSGERLYAVPAHYTGKENWVSEKGYPQGLVVSHIRNAFKVNGKDVGGRDWLDYPIEGVGIENVYPGFRAWIEGSGTIPDWANPIEGTYVDAIRNYTGSVVNSIYTWDINKDKNLNN